MKPTDVIPACTMIASTLFVVIFLGECDFIQGFIGVSLLNRYSFHAESSDSVFFECYISETDVSNVNVVSKRVAFTRNYIPQNPSPEEPTRISSGVYIVTLSTDPNGAFGAFACDFFIDGEMTSVKTILLRSDAYIVPKNERLTKTVNVGESGVTIDMKEITPPPSTAYTDFYFRRDGVVLDGAHKVPSHKISDTVGMADAGVYECHHDTRRDLALQGLQRLIVRACPAGRWGPPDCDGICDNCYNGGVCHDGTGECICPAGFMGENCLTACSNPGRFGFQCELSCINGSSDVSACMGAMICLPDPFGCRCASGFEGIGCQNGPCARGFFGANCLQTCHCKTGFCNPYTGVCFEGGCERGFSGGNCQIPPVCKTGYFGEMCTKKCHCVFNSPCNSYTGRCNNNQCAPGYTTKPGSEHCEELSVLHSISGRILTTQPDITTSRRTGNDHKESKDQDQTFNFTNPAIVIVLLVILCVLLVVVAIMWKRLKSYSTTLGGQSREGAKSSTPAVRRSTAPHTTHQGVGRDPQGQLPLIKIDNLHQGDQNRENATRDVSGTEGASETDATVYYIEPIDAEEELVNEGASMPMKEIGDDKNYLEPASNHPDETLRSEQRDNIDSETIVDLLNKFQRDTGFPNLEREFKSLGLVSARIPESEGVAGASNANTSKNRFQDIVPLDWCRPSLEHAGNLGGTHYINATVLHDSGKATFITTQSPLSNTCEDFWQLVYVWKCTCIIALNETGIAKELMISQYWIDNGSVQYGKMTITCTGTTVKDSYVHRSFSLSRDGIRAVLKVNHYQFRRWPTIGQGDFGSVCGFIRKITSISHEEATNDGPVLVHCLNGVGRSGIYIAVKEEMDRLDNTGQINIFETAKKMRRSNPFFFPSKEEYYLCYEIIADYIEMSQYSAI